MMRVDYKEAEAQRDAKVLHVLLQWGQVQENDYLYSVSEAEHRTHKVLVCVCCMQERQSSIDRNGETGTVVEVQ
jgi:hypothetical protein